jgi:hypothetical protein
MGLLSYSKAPRRRPWLGLRPVSLDDERTSPAFFNLLAFVLQFCPTPSDEVALRTTFASIGIVPGKPFDAGSEASSYAAGMACEAIGARLKRSAPRIGFVRSCQTATGHGLVTHEVKRTLANRNEL